MTYIRWEYHESITVTIESHTPILFTDDRTRPEIRSQPGVQSQAARIGANRLLWAAPMALAAGAALVREANRHDALPRLSAAARRFALAHRRAAFLPGRVPLQIGPGDE